MLPEAFMERMRRMLGEEYGAFSETFGEERSQALRLNALKQGADGRTAAEKYGGGGTSFPHLSKVPWAEDGYYYRPEEQPGKHPFHEAGLYYIQEPSAMAPAELLDVQPGERILDLCAAPGGKSTQIAAKMRGQGILVCNEIHPARAKILSENIERMGICNACVTNEAPEHLAELFPGYFDKILVDAPCSGEGMFRKNEGACGEWSIENVELCAKRQDGILDQAARMLRPGGKLVYSTCTFAPEEDEGSVGRFLCRHREFSILPIDKERLGLAGCNGGEGYLAWGTPGKAGNNEGNNGGKTPGQSLNISELPLGAEPGSGAAMASGSRKESVAGEGNFRLEGTLRIWPHRIQGEGHFAALLQKAGGQETKPGPAGEQGRQLREMPGAMGRLGGVRIGHGKPGTQMRPPKGGQAGQDKDMEAFRLFCQENVRLSMLIAGQEDCLYAGIGRAVGMGEEAGILRFGENVYLVPAGMPSLRGLKVLRPGLHLGTLKKNRFEPSHALALALPPEYAAHVWNLDAREPLAAAYLKGQTFPAQGEKGWYLVCVDGFSIGWGKLAGGIMKNHYPIGLRRKDFKES